MILIFPFPSNIFKIVHYTVNIKLTIFLTFVLISRVLKNNTFTIIVHLEKSLSIVGTYFTGFFTKMQFNVYISRVTINVFSRYIVLICLI